MNPTATPPEAERITEVELGRRCNLFALRNAVGHLCTSAEAEALERLSGEALPAVEELELLREQIAKVHEIRRALDEAGRNSEAVTVDAAGVDLARALAREIESTSSEISDLGACAAWDESERRELKFLCGALESLLETADALDGLLDLEGPQNFRFTLPAAIELRAV